MKIVAFRETRGPVPASHLRSLRRAWAPLVFEDEERWEEHKRREPILPAKPPIAVQRKKRSQQTVDGLPVHTFEGLLSELASRARVTYALKPEKSGPSLRIVRTFSVAGA